MGYCEPILVPVYGGKRLTIRAIFFFVIRLGTLSKDD